MRKREEIIRDSSLFEDEREVNIPVYADDKLQNKIKNRELELERKLKEKERLKDKEYRKKKKEEYKETIILLKKGYSVRNIAKLQGIGISTVQRIKNQFLSDK